VLAVLAPSGTRAEGAKPQDVTVGPVTLQIVETASGEKELRHGTRVLAKDYSLNEGLAAKFKDTHARVFDVGPGGNACEGWPAVVTVDKDGKVAIDTTLKGECHYFIVATEEDGFVFIERAVPDVEADRVMVDDVRGGYLAAQHLAALGHKRIGVIAMPLTISSAAGRVEGVRQALIDAGLRLTEGMISIAEFSEREGFRAAQRLLNQQPRPDAIVASSLRLTTGAFAAVQAARLRMPEDVALVGYDEMAWARLCAPPLTVVKQPARALGRTAAALLLSRLDGTRTGGPVTEVLEPTLLVRRSCGAEGYEPSLAFDQNGEPDSETEDAFASS